MTRHLLPLVTLGCLIGSGYSLADKTLIQKIEEKRAKAERMGEDDRGRIYSELAVHEVDLAGVHYTAGESDKGKQAVTDALDFARKASAAVKLKRHNIKQTEIRLRECSRRLEELARQVNFLERDPIKQAAAQIDTLRTELLDVMFAPRKK
jgi:hypothetical protein